MFGKGKGRPVVFFKKNSHGIIVNPYYTLHPIFEKWKFEDLERVMSDSDIQDGEELGHWDETVDA